MAIIIQNIIIPETNAECSEWISYFKKLEDKFGEENAKIIWLKTWQVNGSTSCTAKPEFLQFLKKHDIDVSNAATKAMADISQIGDNMLGLGKNLSKLIAFGIPVTLAIVVGLILYFLFKVAKEASIADIANLTPHGRIINLVK